MSNTKCCDTIISQWWWNLGRMRWLEEEWTALMTRKRHCWRHDQNEGWWGFFFSEHTQCTKKWGAPNFRQDLPPIRCRYHIMCRRWDTLFFLFNVQLLWIRCTLLSGSDFFVGLRIKDEIFNINNRVHKCELLRLKTGGAHSHTYRFIDTGIRDLLFCGDLGIR